VIDSIVRQSRHQFGAEKDVFAPRFAKNMQTTFINLFRCPPEDKVSPYLVYLPIERLFKFFMFDAKKILILLIHNTHEVIILSDNYQFPLSGSSFIIVTLPTQQAFHICGRVVARSEKSLFLR
jgi:hypothetical protein